MISFLQKLVDLFPVLGSGNGKVVPWVICEFKPRVDFIHLIIQHMDGIIQQKVVLFTHRYTDLPVQIMPEGIPVISEV